MVKRMQYDRYIGSAKWAHRKQAFFATHPRECVACGTTEDVQVHHRTYDRFTQELDDDLVALCQEHHSIVHQMHRIRGGTLDQITDETISLLRRRVSRERQRALPEFIPRNQRGAQRDGQGRLRSTLDWRAESRPFSRD